MKKIRRCIVCGEYTLGPLHHGKATVSGHPPRYDPNDRYGGYRRKWLGVS